MKRAVCKTLVMMTLSVGTGGVVAQTPPATPAAPTPPVAIARQSDLHRPTMPVAALEPPSGLVPVLQLFAQGVQRYVCQADEKQPDHFGWVLKEPDAKLFNDSGQEVGHHSAGPSWQLTDGSKVVKTKVVGTMAALSSGDVPWLLVAVTSSGPGVLANVQYVQRIDTVGGVAPTTGCDAHASALQDVGYRATYLFYAPRGK
jgi:hypothetical protein